MRIVKKHDLSAVFENNSSFSILPDLLVSEIFSPLKKKRAIKPSRDKEYSFIHISKWMKLSWKAYILHESNYNTFQEKRNIWEKKKREIWGQWNKLCFPAVRVMGLMTRWSQVTFSSLTLLDIIKVDLVTVYQWKLTECTTPRVNTNVKP